MADAAVPAPPRVPAADAGTDPDTLNLPIGVGRRVVVVANLGLTPVPSPASSWAANGLARALDTWEGPGLVVVAGNTFDLRAATDPAAMALAALDAQPRLAGALKAFATDEERRVVLLPGTNDAALRHDPATRQAVTGIGLQVAGAVDLELKTAAGTRRVRVDASVPAVPAPHPDAAAGNGSGRGARRGEPGAGAGAGAFSVSPDPTAAWQAGLDRLADPAGMQRFLTSRLLYRRFARLAWWLIVPFAVAVVLRFPFVVSAFGHLFFGHPAPKRAIARAHDAGWGARLLFASIVSVVELLILAAVLGWFGRKAWRTLGGGPLDGLFDDSLSSAGATANDAARDAARSLGARGYAGLVTGATLQAELTHLGPGFFACAGAAGEVVEEHAGRLGMPPVFSHRQQLAWVELETGAELHARLLLARSELSGATVLERMAARRQRVHDPHPVVVAAYPRGASWPPAPDLSAVRRRSRRVRRWAAAAIAGAGALDLLSAVTPPLRSRLHLVLEILPLGATQFAGALVALAGLGLLALARGVRRGQHRAWAIAVAVLAVTLVLHLVRGGDVGQSLVAAGRARVPHREPARVPRRVGPALAALGRAGARGRRRRHHRGDHRGRRGHLAREPPPHAHPLWRAGQAVVERLVGLDGVALPDRLDDFLAPEPPGHRRQPGGGGPGPRHPAGRRPPPQRRARGRGPGARHRASPRRRTRSTTSPFAATSSGSSTATALVAYAIYGGVCLVSPDPIGPAAEREQMWAAFRRFADSRGWVVAVMGAGEEWLPVYRAIGHARHLHRRRGRGGRASGSPWPAAT